MVVEAEAAKRGGGGGGESLNMRSGGYYRREKRCFRLLSNRKVRDPALTCRQLCTSGLKAVG
jgi:hypothetical protein